MTEQDLGIQDMLDVTPLRKARACSNRHAVGR